MHQFYTPIGPTAIPNLTKIAIMSSMKHACKDYCSEDLMMLQTSYGLSDLQEEFWFAHVLRRLGSVSIIANAILKG